MNWSLSRLKNTHTVNLGLFSHLLSVPWASAALRGATQAWWCSCTEPPPAAAALGAAVAAGWWAGGAGCALYCRARSPFSPETGVARVWSPGRLSSCWGWAAGGSWWRWAWAGWHEEGQPPVARGCLGRGALWGYYSGHLVLRGTQTEGTFRLGGGCCPAAGRRMDAYGRRWRHGGWSLGWTVWVWDGVGSGSGVGVRWLVCVGEWAPARGLPAVPSLWQPNKSNEYPIEKHIQIDLRSKKGKCDDLLYLFYMDFCFYVKTQLKQAILQVIWMDNVKELKVWPTCAILGQLMYHVLI